MTALIALFAGAKSLLLVSIGGVVAAVAAYFTGRKIAATQTKAADDVAAAKEETHQAQDIVQQQKTTIQAVKNVEQANQSLSDDAARERMRQSKYHSAD